MAIDSLPMTAIVTAYSNENAIVLGADGMKSYALAPTEWTAQKVFPLQIGDEWFAFAWCGLIETESFSLVNETAKAVLTVPPKPNSFLECAQYIICGVRDDFSVRGFGHLLEPNGSDTASMLLAGFFQGEPHNMEIRFGGSRQPVSRRATPHLLDVFRSKKRLGRATSQYDRLQ